MAPLPPEVEERAQQALRHARSIVARHGLKVETTTVHAREAGEGIGRVVEAYKGHMVVLGMQTVEHRALGVFSRTADSLMRHPPCEVLIDSMQG